MIAIQSVTTGGIEFDDIALRRPNLDEVFLNLTGKPADHSTAQAADAAY